MANSGINKAQVQKARNALIARGIHPSIDAVRIELGNTGSKTTITKYLSELQDEETQRLGNANTLSESLLAMVADLANQLQHEAQALVEEGKGRFEAEVSQLKGLLTERERQLNLSQEKCRLLENALANAEHTAEQLRTAQTELVVSSERQAQQLDSQAVLIEQKDAHIRSLEEKHQHARESLEHYRASVKDQREQEQRRHEHQVQQLQTEIRQLGQTISLKQNDITQLTKDSARLAAELGETIKQLRASEQHCHTLTTSAKGLEEALSIANPRLDQAAKRQREDAEELATLKENIMQLQHGSDSMKSELISLKAELSVKNQLIDSFLPKVSSQ